jgi:septum formation protein
VPGVRIILASASPRRKELLAGLGVSFEVFPSEAPEEDSGDVPPGAASAHVLSLARRKAEDVLARVRAAGAAGRSLIVAADTVVVLPDRILGKPSSDLEACEMLTALSGREHTVVTGVVVADPASGETHGATEETRVFFRSLSPGEIAAYVATGEPADKAGAYAVQGVGSLLVARIEGDYFNVVGLPLGCLAKLFTRFGVNLLVEASWGTTGRAPSET